MRDHLISELNEIAKRDKRVIFLTGDLGYVVLDIIKETLRDRFINVGIAEQNMTSLATGLAKEGNIVFTYSLGNFPTFRCLEQIRNDVCYHKANVKILAVGGGLVYGNQGITHHATEDIAIMRVLPNMRVYAPGDAYEAVECLKDAYSYEGPAYIRLARNKEDNFHDRAEPIDISRVQTFGDIGRDIHIICLGSIIAEGIKLRNELLDDGYSAGVSSLPRIKPLDVEGIKKIASISKMIVTMEDHNILAGLGGAVAEIISEMYENHAVLYRAGLYDCFSEITGDQSFLRDKFGFSAVALKPIVINRINEIQSI